jgi:hypothetical protein
MLISHCRQTFNDIRGSHGYSFFIFETSSDCGLTQIDHWHISDFDSKIICFTAVTSLLGRQKDLFSCKV